MIDFVLKFFVIVEIIHFLQSIMVLISKFSKKNKTVDFCFQSYKSLVRNRYYMRQ